jgi:cholera toxin transcriptional activator
MGMIQIENNALSLAPPLLSIPMEDRPCISIRTGNSDCVALFFPELYQLRLIKSGGEEKIDLGYSGSRLLERLARNPGEVVDRDDLMGFAWAGRVVGQGSLNQQIYTLRQILADEKEREIIQTLPRRGYLINPKFVDLAPETVQPVAQPLPQTTAQPVTPSIAPALESVAPTLEQAPVAVVYEDKKDVSTFAPAAAQPPRWRLATVVIGAALLALGSFTIGKITTQPAVKPVSATGKQLTLTYASHTQAELAELTPLGEQLERQLTPQLKQPLHLVLALHTDGLELICLRTDGTAHTVNIDQSRLQTLAVTDIAQCLP